MYTNYVASERGKGSSKCTDEKKTNATESTHQSANVSSTNEHSSTVTVDTKRERGKMNPRVMIVCDGENNSVRRGTVDLTEVSSDNLSGIARVNSEAVVEQLCEDGYDSEGNAAPENAEIETIDEESFPVEEDATNQGATNVEASGTTENRPEEEVIIIARSEIMKLKVDELRTELKKEDYE